MSVQFFIVVRASVRVNRGNRNPDMIFNLKRIKHEATGHNKMTPIRTANRNGETVGAIGQEKIKTES